MLFSEAKRIVAESRGDSGTPNRVNRAGIAIADAIRTWNMRMVWAFTRTEAADLALAAEEDIMTIEGLRRVSSLRMTDPEERKIDYQPRSYIENNVSRIDEPGLIISYDLFMSAGKWRIRFFRAPTVDTTLTVTYYQYIQTPVQDDEELNIPEEYLVALLDYARYYYLRNFSGELERAQVFQRDAEHGLARALRDDKRHPEYRERHMAAVESNYPTLTYDTFPIDA